MSKKTTAISPYNVAVTQQSGKIGNVRYYQKGGNTYVRAAHNSTHNNPRTDKQMMVRLMLASIGLIWATLKEFLIKSYAGTVPSVSSYNQFMRFNASKGVYLMRGNKSQILVPLTVSQGNLPPIGCTVAETSSATAFSSDIKLTGTALSTFGELSQQILDGDTDHRFAIGDKISFILSQQINSLVRPSYINTVAYQFVIDPTDTTELADFSKDSSGNLAVSLNKTGAMLGGAFIHSRLNEDGGGFDVSSQDFVLTDACDYQSYLTDAAFELAAASYGKRTKIYLRP